MEEFHKVISLLEVHGRLPMEYKPHKLTGNYAGTWECHVKPDWLLLWQQDDKELVLLFLDTEMIVLGNEKIADERESISYIQVRLYEYRKPCV